MLLHPDLDSWISLDRTGEPQQLAHGNSTLMHRAGPYNTSAPAGPAARNVMPRKPECRPGEVQRPLPPPKSVVEERRIGTAFRIVVELSLGLSGRGPRAKTLKLEKQDGDPGPL